MGFKDRSWNDRFQVMGDTAEGVFAEVAPLGRFQRFGWRRPDVSMYRMSAVIRHMPDFYASTGHLVEVMGCGKDGILKLKLDKLASLDWWEGSGNEVVLFVWNSHFKQWALISLRDLHKLIEDESVPTDKFPEGNEYYAIPWPLIEANALVGER